eukprot:jgi/Chrzof1/5925/Cz16g20260.t1
MGFGCLVVCVCYYRLSCHLGLCCLPWLFVNSVNSVNSAQAVRDSQAGSAVIFQRLFCHAQGTQLFTDAELEQLHAALSNSSGSRLEERHEQYKEVVRSILSSKGQSLEAAAAQQPNHPHIKAVQHLDEFSLVVQQLQSAADTSNAMQEAVTWEPPPPDEQPETAQDYE